MEDMSTLRNDLNDLGKFGSSAAKQNILTIWAFLLSKPLVYTFLSLRIFHSSTLKSWQHAGCLSQFSARGRGEVLPSNRLMGMCRWMGLHFHDWIDYNGVAFSIGLLEWGHIFSEFGRKNILAGREFRY